MGDKKEDYQVEETVQDVESGSNFEERLDSAVEQNKEEFYKSALKQASETIEIQNKQLESFNRERLEFRDDIAIRCFIPLIPLISGSDNYRKAASDAYRAADDFLRVREGGSDDEPSEQ